MIKKCLICEKEYTRYGKQSLVSKTCSFECLGKYNQAKPDTVCTYCGKEFHMKKYRKERYSRNFGYYCSKSCCGNDRKNKFTGDKNHQFNLKGHLNSSFKGLETQKKNHKYYDIFVYFPTHPYCNKDGRVKKHRLIVEENYHLFNFKYFEKINDQIILKNNIDVHHIDENHDNNSIDNLIPLTRGEHTKLHIQTKKLLRNNSGRIIGVVKLDKLLENQEVDNQQPIISLKD